MFRFVSVFIASFFLSIHFGIILYVNSSLLDSFFKPNVVSLIFLLGAIANIFLFLFASKLIRLLGKRLLLFISLSFILASTLVLALSTDARLVATFFILYTGFLPLALFCLDIFLEELSSDTKTGEIRGLYLTLLSLGIALGPLLLSFITSIENDLRHVYLAGAHLLIVPILLAIFSFKSHAPKAHQPYHHSPKLPFRAWWQNRDVRRVTLARFILEFFFTIMVIYVPIYLHTQIGFEWSELGIIFTVMLLPFILFEWPAGELADRLWGEKEIMSFGFFVTGMSLLVMPFLGKVFLGWMAILFISRVGASLIEVMTESYFFKKVVATDTGLISIFRLSRSVATVFGTLVAALTLSLFSFEKIFFVLAVVIFFGLKESLHIRDTL